jgi:amino acid adenylation domain-containing protein
MHPQIEMIRNRRGDGILDWLTSACGYFGEQTAIEWRDTAVSYSCLNKMANQRANQLIANGISQGCIVTVMLDDRIEMIATLLGVFRAGAVFVPLDPTFPDERLACIVAELDADAFIIEAQHIDKVKTIYRRPEKPCKLFTMGHISPERTFGDSLIPISQGPESFSAKHPKIRVDPEAMRYIYYTSGSTGDPKGIAGRLAGLSHFIQWEIATFNIESSWRASQFTTPTFDAYFRDVFVPLCAGSTIVIPPERPANLGSDLLIDWIDRKKVNLIHCVPSLLRSILSEGAEASKFRSVQYVLVSGEVLLVSDVKRWMEIVPPDSKLVNLYGATETTMVKFFHIVQATDVARGFIPIGKPMNGAKAVILDQQQRPCPPGVTGEIYIRTPFRTLGYYKNPEATKQVFVKNPFNDDPSDLIYRTGDLGLVLNDGNFRFIGRKDNLVKIRGIRVELGDIENHLLSHPLVSAAVVIAQHDSPDDARLIAYFVSKQKPSPSFKELREFLKLKVPDYMMPSVFVMLDALPLLPNGKVDRRALPAPEGTRIKPGDSFVPPKDALELQLTKIWEKVLGCKPIGLTDNFFELGGHSLLAVRLFAKMEELTGKKLPLVTLFQAPTIEQLVGLLREREWCAPWKSLVPIQPGGSKQPFFCIHAHEGNVLFYRDLARYLGPDQPFYALQAQGLDGEEAPCTRVEEMAAHYINEIRTVQPDGPYFLGGYCFGGVIVYEMARKLYAEGEPVAMVALLDSFAPGYLRSLPNQRSFLDRARHLFRKLEVHVRNLLLLHGASERCGYIKARLIYLNYKLRGGTGGSSAQASARSALLKAMSEASRNYEPGVYPGRLTLIRAAKLPPSASGDQEMGWGRFAGGGLEVHKIPGYYAHTMLEPRVRELAAQLRVCINQAQSTEFCTPKRSQLYQPRPALNPLAGQTAI